MLPFCANLGPLVSVWMHPHRWTPFWCQDWYEDPSQSPSEPGVGISSDGPAVGRAIEKRDGLAEGKERTRTGYIDNDSNSVSKYMYAIKIVKECVNVNGVTGASVCIVVKIVHRDECDCLWTLHSRSRCKCVWWKQIWSGSYKCLWVCSTSSAVQWQAIMLAHHYSVIECAHKWYLFQQTEVRSCWARYGHHSAIILWWGKDAGSEGRQRVWKKNQLMNQHCMSENEQQEYAEGQSHSPSSSMKKLTGSCGVEGIE